MRKEWYDEIDELALTIRTDYNHFDKRLDVFKLANDLNLKVVSYSSLNNDELDCLLQSKKLNDGFTFVVQKSKYDYQYAIFYNDKLLDERIRFTIAHEIFHTLNFGSELDEYENEILADHFARYILIPPCLLALYSDNLNNGIVPLIFDVSVEAANNAIKAFNNRIKGGGFMPNAYELKFLEGFLKHQDKKLLVKGAD